MKRQTQAPTLEGATWFTSSYSGTNNNCVEVAFLGSRVAVRDTKANGAGPVHVFTSTAWRSFVATAKTGTLDVA